MSTASTSGLPPSRTAPAIVVSSRDFNRLEQLLDSPALRRHPAAIALMDELNRAEVLPPHQIPDGVVTMHSTVECEDELSGDHHSLTLVYPNEANVDKGHVSILAPGGSALLGAHRRLTSSGTDAPAMTSPRGVCAPCIAQRSPI